MDAKTTQRKRMRWAGKIPPRALRCLHGHVGPFRPRPDLTAWKEMNPSGLPQVDCLACLSSISDPRRQVAA